MLGAAYRLDVCCVKQVDRFMVDIKITPSERRCYFGLCGLLFCNDRGATARKDALLFECANCMGAKGHGYFLAINHKGFLL